MQSCGIRDIIVSEVIKLKSNDIIVTDIVRGALDTLLPGQHYMPRKPRDCHAIAYIIDGSMRYRRENTTVELAAGEIIFVKAGCIDYTECVGSSPVSYIPVDFCTLDDNFELPVRFSPGERGEYLFEAFRGILDFCRRREFGWRMDAVELLYRILNELRRICDDSTYKRRRIAPALSLLDARLSDSTLTVADLAAECGMSAGTLTRAVRSLYGCSTSELIHSRRMERACELLRGSVYSVTEIAAMCGFGDIYAFSHAFRRTFGTSPTDWRG